MGTGGGSYRWFDATGAQVTDGSELSVFDANGHLWSVGSPGGAAASETATGIYYTEPGCLGDEVVFGTTMVPRIVYNFAELGGAELVRPDTLQSTYDCFYWNNDCSDYGEFCTQILFTADLIVAGPPPGPWVGPLHPEPL